MVYDDIWSMSGAGGVNVFRYSLGKKKLRDYLGIFANIRGGSSQFPKLFINQIKRDIHIRIHSKCAAAVVDDDAELIKICQIF